MAKTNLKRIAIGILISISAYLFYQDINYLIDYYMAMNAQILSVEIASGPVDVKFTDATEWKTVAQAIVTILATYAGIKIINRIFE